MRITASHPLLKFKPCVLKRKGLLELRASAISSRQRAGYGTVIGALVNPLAIVLVPLGMFANAQYWKGKRRELHLEVAIFSTCPVEERIHGRNTWREFASLEPGGEADAKVTPTKGNRVGSMRSGVTHRVGIQTGLKIHEWIRRLCPQNRQPPSWPQHVGIGNCAEARRAQQKRASQLTGPYMSLTELLLRTNIVQSIEWSSHFLTGFIEIDPNRSTVRLSLTPRAIFIDITSEPNPLTLI